MSDYEAKVAKIDSVCAIDGADRIQVGFVLGSPVIISKEASVGDLGIFFAVDVKLSDNYCKVNNLYRHSEANADNTKTGFFDLNRRVRAQPFMKVKSCGYFAPLGSLGYTGVTEFKLGDSFGKLGGMDICEKYVSPATQKAINERKNKGKAKNTKSAPMFHQHTDTSQFTSNLHRVRKGDIVSIYAKRHGTSARYGLTKLSLDIPKWQQFVNKFINKYPTEQWEYMAGTRRVNLYPRDIDKVGFHGSEQYRYDILELLKPHLARGMTIYGEICGYANEKPIMGAHSTKGLKNKAIKKKYGESVVYKYGCESHESRFHIYRITQAGADGSTIDYSHHQIEGWCDLHGFEAPLLVHPQLVYNADKDTLVKLVEDLTEREGLLTEDFIDPTHISEGVVVRIDSGDLTPVFLKSKSFIFKVMEGIAKEQDDFVDEEEIS